LPSSACSNRTEHPAKSAAHICDFCKIRQKPEFVIEIAAEVKAEVDPKSAATSALSLFGSLQGLNRTHQAEVAEDADVF